MGQTAEYAFYQYYTELTFCNFGHIFSSPKTKGSHNNLFDFFSVPRPANIMDN